MKICCKNHGLGEIGLYLSLFLIILSAHSYAAQDFIVGNRNSILFVLAFIILICFLIKNIKEENGFQNQANEPKDSPQVSIDTKYSNIFKSFYFAYLLFIVLFFGIISTTNVFAAQDFIIENRTAALFVVNGTTGNIVMAYSFFRGDL